MSKDLYASDFYDDDDAWSEPLVEAGRAVYDRLHIGSENPTPFEDLEIDEMDHYIIAGRNAVRAFYKEAERR